MGRVRTPRRFPSPAWLLPHAHISTFPTVDEGVKVLQTVAEGDWPGRPGRWVAVPTAELCDDPAGPGQAVGGVRVLLERRSTLDMGVEAFEHVGFRAAEGVACGLAASALASLHELEDYGRRPGGDGCELQKLVGAGQLTVLDAQAVQLHQAKQLLDRPAQLVPVDDPPGGRRIGDGVRGEEAPIHR